MDTTQAQLSHALRLFAEHPAAPAELGGVEGIYGVESLPLAWSQV